MKMKYRERKQTQRKNFLKLFLYSFGSEIYFVFPFHLQNVELIKY